VVTARWRGGAVGRDDRGAPQHTGQDEPDGDGEQDVLADREPFRRAGVQGRDPRAEPDHRGDRPSEEREPGAAAAENQMTDPRQQGRDRGRPGATNGPDLAQAVPT